MLKKMLWISLILATAIFIAACAGPAGQTGPAGTAGPTGSAGPAGPSGPAGPAGTAGPRGPAGPAGKPGKAASPEEMGQLMAEKFSKSDRKLALWDIQPGTAAQMIELLHRFNTIWFAGQAGNWDLVMFETHEAEEAVEVLKTTRPSRFPAVDAWAKANLEAIEKAAMAKDKAAFEKAYDDALAGCNGCHIASEGGPLKTLKSIKITRPTAPIYSNMDFKGQ